MYLFVKRFTYNVTANKSFSKQNYLLPSLSYIVSTQLKPYKKDTFYSVLIVLSLTKTFTSFHLNIFEACLRLSLLFLQHLLLKLFHLLQV